jgi:hypothetical protein
MEKRNLLDVDSHCIDPQKLVANERRGCENSNKLGEGPSFIQGKALREHPKQRFVQVGLVQHLFRNILMRVEDNPFAHAP